MSSPRHPSWQQRVEAESRSTCRDHLTAIRRLTRAADDNDLDSLHSSLERVRVDVLLRWHASKTIQGHPANAMTIAEAGVRRLLVLLNEVLFDPAAEPGRCACLLRLEEITAALHRQMWLEEHLRSSDRK